MTSLRLACGTVVTIANWVDDRVYGTISGTTLENEWTIANVVDAAVDEQRRRISLKPLPPRDDRYGNGWPNDPNTGRWPGVYQWRPPIHPGPSKRPVSGCELADWLGLIDDDLRSVVIQVYSSIIGSIEAFTVGKSVEVKIP